MTYDENAITIAQTYAAGHDVNGNPRRVWVGYSSRGRILAVKDHGYGNPPAWYREAAACLPTVYVVPSEYRDWMRRGENIHGQYVILAPNDDVVARFNRAATARRFLRDMTGEHGCRVVDAADVGLAYGQHFS